MFTLTRLRLPIAVIGAVVFAALLAFGAFSSAADANHIWRYKGQTAYHWATTSIPFTLSLGNNLSGVWVTGTEDYLGTASGDWSESAVLDTQVLTPGGTTGEACDPTEGRVEVCNADYGRTGWLGLAQIWATNGHITQGTTKVNDYYFNQDTYNTPAWRQSVLCQEIGHNFGLDHQDENFRNANLGTCMDYSNDPDGGPGGRSDSDLSNEHPNAHDYEQLSTIYGHTDSTNTIRASAASKAASRIPLEINQGDLNSRAQWGQLVHTSSDGRLQVYEREVNGYTLITFVKKA